MYPASSDIKDANGNVLVTVYSLQRPDGQWAILLVNKDQSTTHDLTVTFNDASSTTNKYFNGNVTQVSFGSDNYTWHPNGINGTATPDGPSVTSTQSGGSEINYTLPKSSVTVLRGVIQ